MIARMIIDADLCIKLGGSDKYRYLYEVLPQVAEKLYMHRHAYGEVMAPTAAVRQLQALVQEGKVELVNEELLAKEERLIYTAAFRLLSRVMIDPRRPKKNRGEVCSLAYARAATIPIFATDERELQPLINSLLNTGKDDIRCLRIVDIVVMARQGLLDLPRKVCKGLWVVAGKRKEAFDLQVWPLDLASQ